MSPRSFGSPTRRRKPHEATAESLMRTVHAHPTLYEALGEAEHAAAEGAAIHI